MSALAREDNPRLVSRQDWWFEARICVRMVWLALYPWNRWQGDSHADLVSLWRLA